MIFKNAVLVKNEGLELYSKQKVHTVLCNVDQFIMFFFQKYDSKCLKKIPVDTYCDKNHLHFINFSTISSKVLACDFIGSSLRASNSCSICSKIIFINQYNQN